MKCFFLQDMLGNSVSLVQPDSSIQSLCQDLSYLACRAIVINTRTNATLIQENVDANITHLEIIVKFVLGDFMEMLWEVSEINVNRKCNLRIDSFRIMYYTVFPTQFI